MKKSYQNYLNAVLNPSKKKDDIIDMNWRKLPRDIRNKIIEQISSLPILRQLPEILEAIKHNLITIIEAKTWSWKTTQVGKLALLLKNWKRKKWFNKVHMTQPRVIAALSNASRISDELLSQIDNPLFTLWEVVWYRTWNFDKTSDKTRLLLTTDAQEVLRQLVSNVLPDYLILDEVHTYTVDIEILFALMKQYIAENPNLHTKFIIMTATLDKKLILNYLKENCENPPYFNIPWKVYPIDEYILSPQDFINTIVENTDIDWDWKVLVFVEWKRKIYETIKKLKEIFWKNKKEAKINQIHLEIQSLIDTSLNKLSQHLEDNFEKIVNKDSFKQFVEFFLKEVENKIKNVSYIINEDKIYANLYKVLYTDIFMKAVELSQIEEILNDIYSNWLETTRKILEDVNYIDYKISSCLDSINNNFEKVKLYKNIIISHVNISDIAYKDQILESVNNISFWFIDGFNFLIKDFLRRTVDKWVNQTLVEKNINLAAEYLHPSKIYKIYERVLQNIVSNTILQLKSEIRTHIKKIIKEEKKEIFNLIMNNEIDKLQKINTKLIEINNFYHQKLVEIERFKKDVLKDLWKNIFNDNLYEEFVSIFNQTVKEIDNYLSSEIKIIPLHSDLSKQDQEKAFDKDTKIIVATDIAEMSLTIPNTKTVVDNWKVRIAYIDDKGIETLEVIDISKAQSKQRKWRTGRTWPWKYVWTNSTPPEQLKDFPITDIEKGNFARHYLILLAGEKRMEEMDFLHQPSENHIELVKEHLKNLWALDDNYNITGLGEQMVLIPTEPYIARMLVEAEHRNCLWNMIVISSIFESKVFLSEKNKSWEKISFEKKYWWVSDLFFYYQWYELLTSRKLSDFYKNQLVFLWIEKDILDSFNDNDKQLFEEIDLEKLWIKEKYFLEVLQNVERLTKYYEEKQIKITYDNLKSEDILLSIASWLVDDIYEVIRKNTLRNEKKWYFTISWVSSIKLTKDKNYVYVWKPIIIKSEWKKIQRILQKITRIDKKLIAQIMNKNIDSPTLQLSTKTVWKGKNKKRIKILKQIKPIEGISINDIFFETGNNSFEYMFKYVYLPELFVYKNKFFQKFIEEKNKFAPEWKKFNTKKFKNLIWNYTSELYEYFNNSKESPKKLEEKFVNDNKFFDFVMKQSDIKKFLENPYI